MALLIRKTLFALLLAATAAGGSLAATPTGGGDAAQGGNYNYFFLEAMLQREKGNRDAAFDLLRYCLQLKPDAPEAYFYLAQYYLAMNDKERSTHCFEKAAELSPGNATYLETLAQAYATSNKTKEAIGVLERLAAAHTGRADVLEMLVELYQAEGDHANTVKTLTRLETLEGKNERLSYAKSQAYTQMGDKEAAIKEMKALADQYPNDLNYLGLYGDALFMNGKKADALEIYHSILSREPDNSKAQTSMRAYYKMEKDAAAADSTTMLLLLNKNTNDDARIYIMRQEIAESESAGGDSTQILRFFDAMMQSPDVGANVAILYASYMSLKKMPQQGIERVLDKVLAMEPDNAAARLQLVAYAWQRDDLGRVVSLCKAARQYNPDEMAFYYYEGMAHFRLDDSDDALDALQNGIGVINDESDPDIVSDFYAALGDLLFEKGRKAEAFAAYDSCLQWKDDNLGCLNNYAYYLSVSGDSRDKAAAMSLKTVMAEPKNATYLDTYAWILFMQERYAEAKIYIDQAVMNDTDSSAVITEHAGDIYFKAGDADGALRLWRRAAAKDPDNALLKRKIRLKKYVEE